MRQMNTNGTFRNPQMKFQLFFYINLKLQVYYYTELSHFLFCISTYHNRASLIPSKALTKIGSYQIRLNCGSQVYVVFPKTEIGVERGEKSGEQKYDFGKSGCYFSSQFIKQNDTKMEKFSQK